MIISVNKNFCDIKEKTILNKGEYNINKCIFEFSEEYKQLTKKAVFFIDKKAYEVIVHANNTCDIPVEALKKSGYVYCGIYAFYISDGQEILRYSPSPAKIFINNGTYDPNITGSEKITPTQYEQYEQALNDGLNEVREELESVKQIGQVVDKKGLEAENQGNYAKEQGDYAKEQGLKVEEMANEEIQKLENKANSGVFNGKDATINGFNTLNIVAGTNIDLKQENDTLEINNTYQYDDSDLVKQIDNINDNFKNYSLITETGNKLDLTIDSKTYIMTLKLKDKDDNVLSTGSVDLPIESMIINVTYDNDNEKLTFTLQNGSVIDVPLDSLISGLVNETDLKDTLKDYVKNTDYATSYKAGVIRTGGGATLNNYGVISPAVRNYAEYNASGDTLFLSKGTFENAIAGKNLETANNKVNLVNENSTDTQYPSAKCTYEIKNNLDRLKDNVLEVGEASDTYIHVEDSSLNELKELEVEGVCEQETTTGKNLLPNKIQSKTVNGITCTNNNDGTVTLNGTATAKTYLSPSSAGFISLSLDGDYTFSANTYNNISYALYHGSAETFFWAVTSDKTFSATGSFGNVRPQINIESGVTLNNVIVKFQLEKGSTATEYEPYTEGQATPSPDYPQEIKTITDSLSMTSNNGKDETEENYLESVITANLPEGEFIGKLNDTYKNTLKVVYKEDGKHHLVLNKIISKTVLNGTQPISYSKVINDDKFVAQFNIGTAIKSSSTMISDKFIYMSNGWASNSENISTGGSNNNLLQMKILQSRLEEISSNGLTNWLSTHPVEVYYALENPYEVDLGIVDMPLSYSGVTNIFTDSDLLPKINAKYYKDFKLSIKNYINSYIDNKLNELQSTANDVATADNTQSDENQNSDLS
ncbi:putative uncharacterized protein [Clostridium sp. CAG:417]|nr:putative uncharacterized protein [Clostridium sp. CAG:417]